MSRGTVSSPITGEPANFVRTIPKSLIISRYQDAYGIDVERYFQGLDGAALYACVQTGYQFFHPETLCGDASLYAALEKNDWFYKSDKWEYGVASSALKRGENVLDIGCGVGHFLKLAAAKGAQPTGLEFSSSAVARATESGLPVTAQSIQDHPRDHAGAYDVVTTFQVLEHVYDVASFLKAAIDCVKPGGKLIVGVPDNAGFMRFADHTPLNLPPHHVGRWTAASLSRLSEILPLELLRIEHEPLAEKDWFLGVVEREFGPSGWKRFLYHRLGGHKAMASGIDALSGSIHGHTVLALYRKPIVEEQAARQADAAGPPVLVTSKSRG